MNLSFLPIKASILEMFHPIYDTAARVRSRWPRIGHFTHATKLQYPQPITPTFAQYSTTSTGTMHAYVELALSWLLRGVHGHDEKSFCRSPAFAGLPGPTVELASPDCGPGSPSQPARLRREHSADGPGTMPSLEWRTPEALEGRVREWLLVVEDPDAPVPTPIPHG